jgi:hypothetical protein
VSVLWSLLALPILAVVVGILYQHFSGAAEEHRKLRREGAEVVTPAKELVNGLGPEGIMLGSDEQVAAYLDDCFKKWWDGLRGPLMIYVNHHPSQRVRALGEKFAISVGVTLASTRYLFLTRKTATDMKDYDASVKAKKDSLAMADKLLDEIRRRSPGWLRRSKWSRRHGERRQLDANA